MHVKRFPISPPVRISCMSCRTGYGYGNDGVAPERESSSCDLCRPEPSSNTHTNDLSSGWPPNSLPSYPDSSVIESSPLWTLSRILLPFHLYWIFFPSFSWPNLPLHADNCNHYTRFVQDDSLCASPIL
ncbi:hypothetical protein CLIB1423_07S02344 [[Candida] railenensis]|uniref:Uncharacterized protein n=1 Tax=[Candida] railenensis TaxID=45579 RepID=A0A9P0QPK1_9ASCO|nr:hypothetical protein CLIB1423_07S02344 [[Candida] railenensis]